MYSELHTDYVNYYWENENLKQEMFEMKRNIFESSLQSSDFLPHPESTRIIYEQLEENLVTIFYEDHLGYHLQVSDPNFNGSLTIHSMNTNDGINYEYDNYTGHVLFGGVITNNQIEKVKLAQGQVFDASILEINDNFLFGIV